MQQRNNALPRCDVSAERNSTRVHTARSNACVGALGLRAGRRSGRWRRQGVNMRRAAKATSFLLLLQEIHGKVPRSRSGPARLCLVSFFHDTCRNARPVPRNPRLWHMGALGLGARLHAVPEWLRQRVQHRCLTVRAALEHNRLLYHHSFPGITATHHVAGARSRRCMTS